MQHASSETSAGRDGLSGGDRRVSRVMAGTSRSSRRAPGFAWWAVCVAGAAGLAIAGGAIFSNPGTVAQMINGGASSVAMAQAPAAAPAPVVAPAAGQPGTGKAGDKPAVSAGENKFGRPTPIAKPAGNLRIASYNVENLFDDKDDPALSGQLDDAKMLKPLEHRQAAAKAIRAINADVLALQEIESKEALVAFRDEFLKGMGYEHVVSIDSGDDRGIEQAVLSRYPLKDEKIWKELPLGGVQPERVGSDRNPNAGEPLVLKRSPLRVTVSVPATATAKMALEAGVEAQEGKGYEVVMFVVHHKSGGRATEYWRDAEAKKVVELVGEELKANANANVMVLGDFNAEPRSNAMKMYFDSGLLSAFDGAGPGDLSAVTHASGRIIDHVLMSANLRAEFKPETKFVLGTPNRVNNRDWRNTPPPEGWASDHYPVVVDIVPVDQPVTSEEASRKPAGTGN
jgi:endonuclease/exonuclease/phosphatase family metal-dependent hydrolase